MAEQTTIEESTSTPAEQTEADKPAKKRKSRKRSVPYGRVYILATFNNTLITVTDNNGNVLATETAGAAGFRGSKKGTAYAAQVAAEKAMNTAKTVYGLSKADVFVKGVGLGREAAVRTLINQRIQVESIKDITPVAHGGTRPRKARRT